jgi:hypothetical protein
MDVGFAILDVHFFLFSKYVIFFIGTLTFAVRSLYYSVDPHGFRDIFSTEVEAILFWLPVWFLLVCAFLIVLYWYVVLHPKTHK